MVKLQALTEQIHQSPWRQKGEALVSCVPTMFMVSSLEENLRKFRQSLPPEQENNSECDIMMLMKINIF